MPKSVKDLQKKLDALQASINKVILGQEDVVKQILVALLCDSNALLESVPGLGKTTMIKSIADAMELKFSRIQSTPDLMPSDITGTLIILEHKGKQVLEFQQGPLFANLVLADEINRATPKTQSAMLEAMQEKQVTVAGATYELERPFFVLATQNPIDQEGTYPLPEAQTDRFLLKIFLDYPRAEAEDKIVSMYGVDKSKLPSVKQVLKKQDVLDLQRLTRDMPISKELQTSIVRLVQQTRSHKYIRIGASPRASIGLMLAAKAHAMLSGRNFASKTDVVAMALPVLRHRLILAFEAEQDNISVDSIITELTKSLKGK